MLTATEPYYVEDAVTYMRDNGVRRARVFAVSAWAVIRLHPVRGTSRAPPRPGDADGYWLADVRWADQGVRRRAITAAAATCGDARLVFTAHSIPTYADICG